MYGLLKLLPIFYIRINKAIKSHIKLNNFSNNNIKMPILKKLKYQLMKLMIYQNRKEFKDLSWFKKNDVIQSYLL